MNWLRAWRGINGIICAVIASGTVARILTCFLHNPLDFLESDPARHWRHAGIFFQPRLMELSDPIGYFDAVVLLPRRPRI